MFTIRPYTDAMRKQGGWEKDGDSVAGGGRCVSFKKVVGERTLELQLYADGKHRVSHFLSGRMSTYPTEFTDVAGMLAGIETELYRIDHPPRIAPGTLEG